MLRLIKKTFMGLSISTTNASNHAKCVSLSNEKCLVQPTLISLHPYEHSQKFYYYPVAITLNWFVGSFNRLI